ncbi:MAG: hypothetical protein L0H31_04060 [Nocardioidaceae bacterium]|nr:hypothetical protein [Nocardioidaceae bacterium]
MHTALLTLSLVSAEEEKAPDANDVVAGWTGFLVFVLLIVAVAVIGWALTRSLRTAQRAKEEGVYGDEPGKEPPATVWAPTEGTAEAESAHDAEDR